MDMDGTLLVLAASQGFAIGCIVGFIICAVASSK